MQFKAALTAMLSVIVLSMLLTACDCRDDDDDQDKSDKATDDNTDCIICMSTEECTNALGAGWVCKGGCCADVGTDDSSDDTTADDTTGEDDDTGTTTTTFSSTTSTTTTVSTTTTSTTTTTQPPLLIHATNIFNDAIDISVSIDEEDHLESLLGGWSFLSGRPADDWYETFDVEVTEDIPLVYSPDLSTPSVIVYIFSYGAFHGSVKKFPSSRELRLEMEVEGAYGDLTDLSDQIHGVTPPDACADRYPPLIFGEILFSRDCITGEEGASYFFDEELDFWWVSLLECVNLYFYHSDPDCDWENGVLYRYSDVHDQWNPVPQYAPDEGNCSWFTSDGQGLLVGFQPGDLHSYLFTENEFKITDECGMASNQAEIRVSYYPTAYDSSAQSVGRNAKLAEEVYYNDHGGDISGGYTDRLSDLLYYDHNLTDDPEVTFSFGVCDQTGYTFITKHLRGTQVYTWTD